jgi:hypothetical protein
MPQILIAGWMLEGGRKSNTAEQRDNSRKDVLVFLLDCIARWHNYKIGGGNFSSLGDSLYLACHVIETRKRICALASKKIPISK